MFFLNDAKTKLLSDSQESPVNQDNPDPNKKPGLKSGDIKNLVIHCVQASSMQNAINRYLTKAISLHLLIERDGKQIAQMVDFDHVAVHANEYDNNSLGIGLIYPGYLTEKSGFFYSKDRFDPKRIIKVQSVNDDKQRWYPLFPQEQIEALLEIIQQLDQAFEFERILVRQEINQSDLISGPAFPINRLRQLLQGEGTATELLEETSLDSHLFLQPGGVGLKVLDQPVPVHTPIVVIDEAEGWVLVEVMAPLGDRRWTVGWMKADQVAVKDFEPGVSDDHMLITEDNRRIKFIAAHEKNFDADGKLEPRFVVIHFTTGTNMMSTVHTFLNPENGVSTHLLVGRSGQVIQFVPFDKIAFHCGLSTWEGERFLNRFSIGIEVDNAGYLRKSARGYTSRGKLIPEDQYEFRRHWKEQGVRAWQTFTDEQIKVVEKIVQALKNKYPTIEEIVGHDMVNLINRLDPGPLYPLGELREAILGDPQQEIKAYRTTELCPIYVNIGYEPPKVLPHPDFGELPKNSNVRVKEVYDHWSKVRVKQSKKNSLREKEGWVLSQSIEPEEEKSKTKFSQTFYKIIPAVEPRLPPLELKSGPLPEGTHVRIQFMRGERWALVAPVLEVLKGEDDKYEVVIPEDKVKKNFLEGWVEQKFLQEVKNSD